MVAGDSMKILLRAPLLTQSGYGVHSRQVYDWLKSVTKTFDCAPLNWGNTAWYLDRDALDGRIGEIIDRSRAIQQSYDVSLQLQLPDEWDIRIAKINIGITAGVETDFCNPVWIDSVNRMSLVIVPSQHTKNAFVKSAKLYDKEITTQICVIPEFYEKEYVKPATGSVLDLNKNFNFLIVGQLTDHKENRDRKNNMATVRALLEEFTPEDDVGVVIKTNSSRNTKIDRAVTQKCIEDVVNSTRSKLKRDTIPILYVHGNMTNEEMNNVYRDERIKAYVNLTSGEGFGLPIMEAALAGLPVIATDWSAHTEYLGDRFSKVSYRLKHIPSEKVDGRIFVAGSSWAKPDMTDFAKKARALVSDETSYTLAKTSANAKSEHLKDILSSKKVFYQYSQLLGKIIK